MTANLAQSLESSIGILYIQWNHNLKCIFLMIIERNLKTVANDLGLKKCFF